MQALFFTFACALIQRAPHGMEQFLTSEASDKISELRSIRERNNTCVSIFCDYINRQPRLITKAMMQHLEFSSCLHEEAVFTALLEAAYDLNTEQNEEDRILVNEYLRPAIRRLDPETYANNPYYRNIRIPKEKFHQWELGYETYEAYEGFIYQDLRLSDQLKETPSVGFFREDFHFPAVRENGREWMAIKPNEIETSQDAVNRAKGKTITFGLGLGYFAYMASLKPEVESVTIVERDQDVICLFEQFILPQFEYKYKIKVVLADAFEYASLQMPAEDFDFAFVDLWHDVSDGLNLFLRMKELEKLSPQTHFSYWMETSLYSALRWKLFDRIISHARSYDEALRHLKDPFLLAVIPCGTCR